MQLSHFPKQKLTASIFLILASTASGQNYPAKPIRIVGAEAGGSGDFAARLIAPELAASLGQQVIVDNRSLAGELVSKAPPDGYTLLLAGGTVILGPLLRKVPYDLERDFLPITLAVSLPNILVVHPSLPVKSVKELIALAKNSPGDLNYSTTAPGASSHLGAELFKAMAGVDIVQIRYRGNGQALAALLGGQVHLTFAVAAAVTSHVKSGRLRALAITSAQPTNLFPGLSTVAASGLPGYEVTSIIGIWAPAKTPEAIVNRLNQELVRVLKRPDVREKFLNAGVETIGNTPEEFAAKLKTDMAKYGKLIRDAGIRAE